MAETIGLMALAFLTGYALGRFGEISDHMRHWQAGYLAGERATRTALRVPHCDGGEA